MSVSKARRCFLPLDDPRATPERLSGYLSMVDRPLTALLARQRLRCVAPGRFVYQSQPLRLLRFELIPTVSLQATWEAGELRILSGESRISGLGGWDQILAFCLEARLRPGTGGLEGEAGITLSRPTTLPRWAHSLSGAALDQALGRIERRLHGGLRRDLLAWLCDTADSS